MPAKERGWVPSRLWKQVKGTVPIPCVDIIVSNDAGAVLLGWRVIHPYVNVWALPGGRIRTGEDLQKASQRILASHKITARELYLVGVFPIRFPSRFDISICVAAGRHYGTPTPDGTEFTRLLWFTTLPRKTGKNYREMVEKWRQMKQTPQLARFNKI